MHVPEHQRRSDDQTYVARVAYSPYANIAHLAATLSLLVTVAAFGVKFYATVETNKNRAASNAEHFVQVDRKTDKLSSRLTSVEKTAERNTEDIRRVERQAKDNRQEIIKRLESLNSSVNELNRYLRSESLRRDQSRFMPATPTADEVGADGELSDD